MTLKKCFLCLLSCSLESQNVVSGLISLRCCWFFFFFFLLCLMADGPPGTDRDNQSREKRVTRGSLEFFCLLTRVFTFWWFQCFTFSQRVNLRPSTTFKTTDITEPEEEGFLLFLAVRIYLYQISIHQIKSDFFFLLSKLHPSS